jgi:hypothetical protein
MWGRVPLAESSERKGRALTAAVTPDSLRTPSSGFTGGNLAAGIGLIESGSMAIVALCAVVGVILYDTLDWLNRPRERP